MLSISLAFSAPLLGLIINRTAASPIAALVVRTQPPPYCSLQPPNTCVLAYEKFKVAGAINAYAWVYDRQCNEIGARSTSDPLIQDDITLIETSLGCDIFLAWRDPPAFTYWNFNFNGSCNCVLSEGQAPGDKVWTCPFVCMDFCSDPITDPSHETVSQTKVGGVGALMRRE